MKNQEKAINNDPGFGTRKAGARSMNKDGSFNVHRVGVPWFRPFEIYHNLIKISWPRFFIYILGAYFIANLIFAGLYYLVGLEHLSVDTFGLSDGEKFLEAFFFSSQTLTTLGYGRVAPIGVPANTIAAIESMTGLLGFAWATGLTYGRFSKPQSKILYSDFALISPYRGSKGLMFRITNMRSNQLIEVEADVTVGFDSPETGTRSFARLELERSRINLFPSNWTIVHPINTDSIFYNKGEAELRNMNIEIYVLLKAFDDTFSQTIYSRTSYTSDEIIFGAKFTSMFRLLENGSTLLDLKAINNAEKVELPV